MKQRLLLSIAVLAAAMAALTGCRSGGGATVTDFTATSKAWRTMQTGGSMTIGSDRRDFSSSMQMRMIADRQIVISLRPLLGIEMGKMIIDNDSILMIDKWHKQYMLEPVSAITSGMPVTVGNLQDVFTAREFAPAPEVARLFTCVFFRDGDNRISALEIHTTPGSGLPDGTYEVSYDDVSDTDHGDLPGRVNATATMPGGKTMTLALKYSGVKWDKDIKAENFAAPSNYKRITIKNLMSLFGDNDK